MPTRVTALLLAAAASVLSPCTNAQQPPPLPSLTAPMLANNQYLFVLHGDTLFQFNIHTLELLHSFDFAKAKVPAEAQPNPADVTVQVQLDEPKSKPTATRLAVTPTIDAALGWLVAHQDEDGKWDADGFMKHDESGEPCDGPGNGVHDVGATGLAMLAMLANGSTLRSGPYKQNLQKAVNWLKDQQQQNGLLGLNASHDFIYDHAIAAFALCETYGLSQYARLKQPAQQALNYLESHRNPYGVWRYQPRDNDNDTSVTTWALFALTSGKYFSLDVNPQALQLVATWYDQVTDPTGMAGYTKLGEPSSRHPGNHGTRFPVERGEAMTAAALAGRFMLGQDPKEKPIMKAAADRIISKPPQWQPDRIDAYYWYMGTMAMYQMGGRHWQAWMRGLQEVAAAQRKDGNFAGSWDPIGVWDADGGRVYTTALYAMSLQTVQRFTKLVK